MTPKDRTRRHFTIVPAAGRSVRMGQAKLLLPWSNCNPAVQRVIDSVLAAWTGSRVDHVVVVVRENDEELRRACERWPVDMLISKVPPPDMKASVQLGVEYLAGKFSPTDRDSVFVAPADIPRFTSELVDRLIHEAEQFDNASILLPKFGSKRGHPALLPWPAATKVRDLAVDEGVNALIKREAVVELAMPESLAFSDIDTPEAYCRERERAAADSDPH